MHPVPVFRENETPPSWCELEGFEIVELNGEVRVERHSSTRRERVLATLGTTQILYDGGSMLLKEGQFIDVDRFAHHPYSLKGCSASAQVVRLMGHWGSDLAGCGIFRVQDELSPSDNGDPVDYRKTTRIDSHYHDCDEYWILLEGRATVVVGGLQMAMRPGDCVTIGMGHHHDMASAPEPVKAVFFETTLEGQKRVGHLWNHTHGPARPHPERT